jgi:hypothetical protein
MYEVLTETGTRRYTIHNGRITRHDVPNPYLPPDVQLPRVNNEPFEYLSHALVGQSLVFRLTRDAVNGEGSWRTSRITEIRWGKVIFTYNGEGFTFDSIAA